MKVKILVFIFLLSSVIGYSQSFKDSLYGKDFDSIMIIGTYETRFRLTANSYEIIKDGVNLLSIFPESQGIDSLFVEFKNAVPFLCDHKVREPLGGDSIAYDWELFYNFSLYNKGISQFSFKLHYDTDYLYFTPEMMTFILHLERVTRYYYKNYRSHLFYKVGIPKQTNIFIRRLQEKSMTFEEKWNKIKKEKEEEGYGLFTINDWYSILFAQILIIQRCSLHDIDIESLIASEKISINDLLYFCSYLPNEEQSLVKDWLSRLK